MFARGTGSQFFAIMSSEMPSQEVREKFIKFWTKPPRDHREIPAVSLVPEVDSTLLFVNSGMFPLSPYLAGQKHPLGTRLCNIQRCLRTKYDEMMEVGDNRHTLMFEMMGNWSLNDYFKKEQIPWMLELYVQQFGLDPNRLYVTVWEGNELVPRDDEAIQIWKEAFAKYDVNAEFSEDIMQIPVTMKDGKTHKPRIFPYGAKDNWWQRGEVAGELGGSTTELFYDTGHLERKQNKYHINDDSGRFLELGNSVFMQYQLDDSLRWQKMEQHNIDFGGGFERAVMCIQEKQDIFETDIYLPIIEQIEEQCKKPYKADGGDENEWTASFRVIADHARAATFIIADGVEPSNKDQGYILRRFIRRLVRFGLKLGLEENFTAGFAEAVIERMKDSYPPLEENRDKIAEEMAKEEEKFRKTLGRGLKEIDKVRDAKDKLTGKKAFYIYESFGFPLEMTLDELGVAEDKAEQIEKEFKKAESKHREKSRGGAEKKFKGGLADQSGITTAYHTVTHILLAVLKDVLGDHVKQQGSNITADRLRFDFNHHDKMTGKQIKKVEEQVNKAIGKQLDVSFEDLDKETAKAKGAEATFWDRYPDKVKVYTIKVPKTGKIYSYEVCGGPHVENTKVIKALGKFKIIKEESSGSGIRRVKAVFENHSQ